MKNILFLFLLLSTITKAQIFTGTVVTENEKPISGVSVYVDGSSVSVVSDASGLFSINISSIKQGNLVFKKEGFTTVIYPFNLSSAKKMKVILAKEQMIEEIKLLHYTDKNFNKYIHRFLNEFLGYERDKVIIKNQKDLVFAFDSENNTIHAKARNPLIIENKQLGYEIEYNLMSFAIDNNRNMSYFTGTSLYKNIKAGEKQQQDWKIKRLNTYYGSVMHFMRSAYNNQLSTDGFIVNRLVKFLNKKYPTEEELSKLNEYRNSLKKLKNNQSYLIIPDDIKDIQNRKMNEQPYKLGLTETKMPQEKFIIKENGKVYLIFKDLLGVVYKKYPYSIERGKMQKSEIPINTSSLIDTDGNIFEITSEGNYSDPDLLIFQDDWGKHKISVTLPLDYQPEI